MNESDFRERLRNMAADVPPPSVETVTVARRAKQRALRNLVATLAAFFVIVVGATLTAQTFQSDPGISPADVPTAGLNACDGSGIKFAQSVGTVTRVSRYPTNVLNLVAWLAGRYGAKGPGAPYSPQWSERDGDASVLVCVYEGRFNVPKGSPVVGPPPQTVLSLIIAEGEQPVLDSVGPGPFKWAFNPAPPGCHPGDKGCDELGVCEWEVDAPLPCGRGVQQGRSYRYRIFAHCGIRQAWFDGRLWQADPIIQDARSYLSSRSEIAEGTMTLVGSNEARFVVVDQPPVIFRSEPPPTPFSCF